jgi:hypothetical protein
MTAGGTSPARAIAPATGSPPCRTACPMPHPVASAGPRRTAGPDPRRPART